MTQEPKVRISRRALIVGAASGATATGTAWGITDVASPTTSSAELYDVIVIGAGLAGLTVATKTKESGASLIVLEARDRVGGRNFDLTIAPGTVLEMGGEWTGPGQTQVQALAKELGIGLFEAYSAGNNLYYRDGRLLTYSGDIPPASANSLIQLENLILTFNKMVEGFPGNSPWTASGNSILDMQSIGSWLLNQDLEDEASFLAEIAIRGIYGEEADQVSMVDLLGEIWGVGGDFNTAIGSAQSTRFVGGPQQMSKGLADRLGGIVRLNSPVTLIERASIATVHTPAASFRAKQVIITVPKSVTAAIRFEPSLPPSYLQYFQRQPSGSTVKIQAVYATPFWRHSGLSGAVVSDSGPIEIVYDNSPPSGVPGVLVGFAEGNKGRSLFGLSQSERRSVVIENLAMYFGPKCLKPEHYVDMIWAADQYSGGAVRILQPSWGDYLAGQVCERTCREHPLLWCRLLARLARLYGRGYPIRHQDSRRGPWRTLMRLT